MCKLLDDGIATSSFEIVLDNEALIGSKINLGMVPSGKTYETAKTSNGGVTKGVVKYNSLYRGSKSSVEIACTR